MLLGTCVKNSNGDVGYTVSITSIDKRSLEFFVRVIWVDPLLQAVDVNKLYPQTLTITNERESGLTY